MVNILSQERIHAHLLAGGTCKIELNEDGRMEAVTYDGYDIVERIPIKELNVVTDFVDHSIKNFRKSDLKNVNAYDGVELTSSRLDQFYCASGMASESAEINQVIIRDFFFNKPIDMVHLADEMSDNFWFSLIFMRLFKFDISTILQVNIIKLGIRYPSSNTNYADAYQKGVHKDKDREYNEIKAFLNSNDENSKIQRF
jgi:hypothetical protein